MDVDTIIPAMLIDAGGTSFHIGLLTAIMLGGSSFTQLFFTPMLSGKSRKKGYLLFGINLRVLALLGLGLLLFWFATEADNSAIIWIIFILITLFSISGAFSAISYSDILGRSVLKEKRKPFLSIRQAISSVGILISAYFAGTVLVEFVYPENYGWLFIIAASSLFIATFGFWNLKEIPGPIVRFNGLTSFFRTVRDEIKSNPRLKQYLLLVNTLGISISLMPFLILYAKENYGFEGAAIGSFLLLKVVAGVLFGTLIFFFSKKLKYTVLLYAIAGLSLLIPTSLYLLEMKNIFGIYFLFGGAIYTLYKVAIEGILLEVSDNQNRTIYIGIVGVGNILPTLFPIFSGWLIPAFGFPTFFVMFSIIILTSVFIIPKLGCKK